MGEPKISDKFFIYGQFMLNLEDFENLQYNSVLGYMTIGGYEVMAIESDDPLASIPGFLVDVPFTPHAVATPFSLMDMVDVTGKLSLNIPLPSGTKVWLPINRL